MKNLQAIQNKYHSLNHNNDNYSIGGGLDENKFASHRHEDARNDKGKLTLGEATQLFKKATKLDTDSVREILEYAVPTMEWHHAGKLPKSYGGGMKKTYFLNAQEICESAEKWDYYVEKIRLSKVAAQKASEEKKDLRARQLDFLQNNAKQLNRVTEKGIFFYMTAQEMNGKFGWFNSYCKSYNMPEYFSGWEFENEALYREFLNIK